MMNPHQILLVKTSFHAALPQSERLSGYFFAELFIREPALWHLFRSKAGMRWPALVDGLTSIVGAIDRLHPIAPVLEWLAIQGAGRGIGERHDAAVGQALIAALEAVLGDRFGPEHRRAWTAACRAVTSVMVEELEDQPLAA